MCPGAEDELYESAALRRFAGVDLPPSGRGPVRGSHGWAAPDETTIFRFRRLLDEHELCGQILCTVNHYLASRGLRIATAP
jgi:IS5 family transposase